MNASQVKSFINKKVVGRHAVGDGLYLRINNAGASSWVVRYTLNSKRREMTIGNPSDMSLADAKLETAQIKIKVRDGIDPLTERKREKTTKKITTVDGLAEDWLDEYSRRLKHPHIPRQVYRDYIQPSLGEFLVDDVRATDVRVALKKAIKKGANTRANDVLMYCKQMFRHAMKLDLIQSNPASPFTVQDAGGVEKSRDRVLSLEELGEALKTLRDHNDQFNRDNYLAVVLLVLLGVRKGELVASKWQEFDLEKGLWDMPEERSKTGVPITVPLSPFVIQCLEELKVRAFHSKFVFPNRRASKRFGHISLDTLNAALKKMFVQERMPMEHFTLHDLRRTFRSLLSSIGVPGHVAERCLNHKLKGVEGIYDRYDYLDERREAMNKLSELLEPIV